MSYEARLKRLEQRRKIKTVGQIVSADVVREVEAMVTGREPTEAELAAIMATRLKARVNPALVDSLEMEVTNAN